MIYKGTNFQLRIKICTSLAGVTDAFIRYKKPNGQTGEWPAVIDGNDFVYDVLVEDIDYVGTWSVQVRATKSSKTVVTQIEPMVVSEPIELL